MSEEEDRAAIIELIHRNRIGIWTRDYELWESCFVHAPYTTRWGWWRRGGVFARTGWDEIKSRVRTGGPPRNDAHAYDTRVENLNLRIVGDMAWATFEQIYPTTYGPGYNKELRVFERHDGEWKIALLGFLDGSADLAFETAIRLDVDGKVLWQSESAAKEIAESDHLVIRNGQLRFRDAKHHVRLRDALHWAAALDTDYMSTHGSRPIVVDGGDGLPVSVYWVAYDAGMILFLFGNSAISESRLSSIALIFGLSPAQAKVAGLVAEGLSLAEIAGRLNITGNTARTHLNRIYEKTGVRTQPALVRVMLSAAAPV
jgi:DNA-binding CsgD family transcriptional regulator